MKTVHVPTRPRGAGASATQALALLAAALLLLCVTALPWLSGRDGSYSAVAIFRGLAGRGVDHSLIALPFVAAAAAWGIALGTLLSPRDAPHWRRLLRLAGILLGIYYANFFVNKGHSVAQALERGGSGFWLALAVGVALLLLGLLPQYPEREAPPTRLETLLENPRFWGVIYLLPVLVLMVTFSIYPVLDSVRITLYNWRGVGEPTQFVGLRHFATVMRDPGFWNAFRNTLTYTAILVPVQLTLAFLLAVVLDNPRLRLRTLYRTLYFLPVVTSIAIVAVVVRLMLQSGGATLTALLGFDPPINPIGHPRTAMLSVTAFGIWYSFGLNLIYFLAALQTVPRELYDAAAVDGANFLQRLVHVTLPGIRPVAAVILFFAVIGSLRVFEQSFVLTGGGPFYASEVVSGYIYRYAFGTGGLGGGSSTPNLGFASAAAFFMSLIILGVTLVQLAVSRFALRRR
jgi:ABC-type sugar transport system permease subunit